MARRLTEAWRRARSAAGPGTLPETPSRVSTHETAPRPRSLRALRVAVEACRACPLWRGATHGVAGEGKTTARVVLVGEQPGDREDLSGKPFVGPAGMLLDRALEAAGIDRDAVFVTNVVKHFKWVPRGKRRIHKTPAQREVAACLDWLVAELRLVRPMLVVCLGATAARALIGRDFKVSERRGELVTGTRWAPGVLATVHPSSILRLIGHDERAAAFARLVADLRRVHDVLRAPRTARAALPAP